MRKAHQRRAGGGARLRKDCQLPRPSHSCPWEVWIGIGTQKAACLEIMHTASTSYKESD